MTSPARDRGEHAFDWGALAAFVGVVVLAAGIVAAVLLGASRADEAGEHGPPPPTDHPEISAVDFGFEPDHISVVAGEDVTLRLTNDGNNQHTWTVLRHEIQSGGDFDESLVLAEVPPVTAGDSDEVTFRLEPGEYQMICRIEGHFDAGMHGTVIAAGGPDAGPTGEPARP